MAKAKCSGLIALILSLAVQPAHSQVLYGSLVGNVTDPSNAAVSEAIVRITHMETNESRQAQTSDTGVYSFPAILAGTYAVEVRKSGFQTATRQEVAVRNNSVVRVDVTLLVGT